LLKLGKDIYFQIKVKKQKEEIDMVLLYLLQKQEKSDNNSHLLRELLVENIYYFSPFYNLQLIILKYG